MGYDTTVLAWQHLLVMEFLFACHPVQSEDLSKEGPGSRGVVVSPQALNLGSDSGFQTLSALQASTCKHQPLHLKAPP